jgi:Putative restriction endonuclease
MRRAPDWIAEVLSPGTASHDEIVKVPVYERAGVREFWLIDPIDRMLSLYRLEAGHYARLFSGSKDKHRSQQFPVSLLIGTRYSLKSSEAFEGHRGLRAPQNRPDRCVGESAALRVGETPTIQS